MTIRGTTKLHCRSCRSGESPSDVSHEVFQIDAFDPEVITHGRDFRAVRLSPFLGDYSSVAHSSGSDDKRIGYRSSGKARLRADNLLEVRNSENTTNNVRLGAGRCGEDASVLFRPCEDVVWIFPLEFSQHFPRRYNLTSSDGPPVTNIRNTSSPHWRGWLKPENRCLVPANSFAEYAPEPNPETKKKDVVWFALNDDRPLFTFAGIWGRELPLEQDNPETRPASARGCRHSG
jgi:hypothetical protein